MASNAALENTIDKILDQTMDSISNNLKKTLEDSKKQLDEAQNKLEQEYDRIISDGHKEADKIEKQIIGSSDLEARNKQLRLVEDTINKVIEKAISEIKNAPRDQNYSKLINSLLTDSQKILGTKEIVIMTNSKDKDVVNQLLGQFSGSELSNEEINCIGGVKVRSKNGTMTFDNTLDARIERMKPLIRKEIAIKFGVSA